MCVSAPLECVLSPCLNYPDVARLPPDAAVTGLWPKETCHCLAPPEAASLSLSCLRPGTRPLSGSPRPSARRERDHGAAGRARGPVRWPAPQPLQRVELEQDRGFSFIPPVSCRHFFSLTMKTLAVRVITKNRCLELKPALSSVCRRNSPAESAGESPRLSYTLCAAELLGGSSET